jgi:hypothetical protein
MWYFLAGCALGALAARLWAYVGKRAQVHDLAEYRRRRARK